MDHASAVLGVGLERAHRQRDQRRDRGGRQRLAAHRPQPEHGDHRDREGEDQEGAPRAHQRDQHERRERACRPGSPRSRARRAARRPCPPPRPSTPPAAAPRATPRRAAAPAPPPARAPPSSEPRNAPAEISSSASTARSSSGSADERHQRQQPGGAQREQAEAAHVRVAVRQAAAEPVADRERHQHDADRVRPDDRGGAEVRGEQPHGGDLRAERARPHHEDEQGQRWHCAAEVATAGRSSLGIPTTRRLASPAMDLAAADRAHLWHPFTQQRGWTRRGAADRRARRGHRPDRRRGPPLHRRRLVALVQRPRPPPPRASTPPCATSSTASPTRRCSACRTARRSSWRERLVEIAPPGLTRVFYSDSGSTATEIALKMAFQYWQQRGGERRQPLRRAPERLPRRHDRLGVGRRHRPVPLDVPPAAVRHAQGGARRPRRHGAPARPSTPARSRR